MLLATLAGAWLTAGGAAQPPPDDVGSAAAAAEARPAASADYTIEVHLDAANRRLDGHQRLRWRNVQQTATDELWFHLYWNAWRNSRSTWMLEDRLRDRSDRGDDIAAGDWSYCIVESARLLPDGERAGADLTPTMRYAAPDDGNPDDRTVLVMKLPEPVEPGASVEVELVWRAKVPRTFARTGFRGDYYFLAHWFPKLGVYEPEGWNCRQYHAGTEYFSDYGRYDVRMTVPSGWVLGATGRQAERTDNDDGTTTHRHVQDDVHAFTWTVSPDYLVRERRFEEPGLPSIDMRLLIQPEHLGQAGRHFAAAAAAFKYYGLWYGPYPYGHVTIVDPAYGSGAGGMEYPTLFTSGTRLFNPLGGGSPESVTIHEAGHQFWYGLVGNDEFEDAWIDEGLNTFSTLRAHHEWFGERRLMERFFTPPGTELSGFFPVLLDGFRHALPVYGERVARYRPDATTDRQDTPTYRYHPATGASLSYSKTALWLATLEKHLGWERLRRGMALFFERWKYRHPRPEDFIAALSEGAEEDLRWFFDQVYRSSAAFDYAVDSVSSRPADLEGLVEDPGGGLVYRPPAEEVEGDEAGRVYRTEVVVRRLGQGVFPVELLMVFEDGEEVRREWDGAYRWKLFVEERPAKLDYAVVDPGNVLMLDLDRTNNSRLREPAGRFVASKWAGRWMVWLQDFLTTFGFFV